MRLIFVVSLNGSIGKGCAIRTNSVLIKCFCLSTVNKEESDTVSATSGVPLGSLIVDDTFYVSTTLNLVECDLEATRGWNLLIVKSCTLLFTEKRASVYSLKERGSGTLC